MSLNPLTRHREHCRETRARMSDYLDGELEPGALAAAEHHVRWCPSCGRMLTNLRRAISGLRRLGEENMSVDEPRP
jgi:anti-sigma factor RsiW